MKRILFVDDETRILDGLKRLLRPMRAEWDQIFVSSGAEALEALNESRFDVIVSDMKMPEMDGRTLLLKVREEHPNVVRIILSGHTELDAALRSIPVAHQFLSKPCDPESLQRVIHCACSLQAVLDHESLRGLVGNVGTLPSQPRIYAALTEALLDPDISSQAIAAVVEQDAGICTRILQVVNSSFIGLPRQTSNVRDAVSYLGTSRIRSLVLTMEVFQLFETDSCPGFSLEAEQRHGLLSATIARILLPTGPEGDTAFMAAMLHDVGKLILASYHRTRFQELLSQAKEEGRPLHAVEREQVGVTHAEVGAYLLGLWGLPFPVVEAVAFHHEVAGTERKSFDAVGVVYLANLLAREQLAGPGVGASKEEIDLEYMTSMGIADRLPAWRELAEQAAGLVPKEG